MKRSDIYRLVLAALFLAIGIVLPFLTMQVKEIGSMLLPMHLPVFLCGLICGWKYGLAVGAILPIMRSLMFGMPMLYPSAVAMAFELATYGLVVGLVFFLFRRKNLITLYAALLISMVAGRAVWGCVTAILLGISGSAFTFSAFLAGALLNAIPGIILQLILIPSVMLILGRFRVVRMSVGGTGDIQ